MQKKLTITIDEAVYAGLYKVDIIGNKKGLVNLHGSSASGRGVELLSVPIHGRSALFPIMSIQHKAMADQVTTVSKERLPHQMGRLSQADMQAVERAIKVQLGL